MQPTIDNYKQDGVDIDLGDEMSKIAGEMCRSTYNNSSFVEVVDLSQGNFRGPRGFVWKNLPEGFINTGSADGLGTRPIIFAASGSLAGSPSSLLAMAGMDITRYGGLPLVLYNILDVKTLGENVNSETFQLFTEAFRSLGRLAKEQGYVVMDGETAELRDCVTSENPNSKVQFNWGGVVIGVYHEDKMVLGNTVRAGQKVLAFQEVVGDNGVSSLRAAVRKHFSSQWFDNSNAQDAIAALATPSAQYDRMFNKAHGWLNPDFEPLVDIHLIAHLSGEAFQGKFASDLLKPQGLSAVLPDLFAPPEILQQCKEWRGTSDSEAYRNWGCGQRALAVVDNDDVNPMLQIAKEYGIEGKVAGEITERKKDGHIVSLKSKFPGGDWVYY
ncbi:MAG: hypothetical protein KAQ63_02915 [Candidatus Moranbacteria bacterium]|nr:hypothetical protein [Candidatus Moranbacteria bacterium]